MKKFSQIKKYKVFEQEEIQNAQQIGFTLPQMGTESNSNTQPQIQVQVQTTQEPTQNTEGNDNNTQVDNQEENKTQENQTVISFFSKLFESREMSHIYHLQVRGEEGSYAKHMALNTYYVQVIEYIDELIEIYQGQYGIIDGYEIIDTKETKTKDTINYFEEIAEYIKHARKCINEEDTHLHNIIDEIVALIYKTLYKLKFNK